MLTKNNNYMITKGNYYGSLSQKPSDLFISIYREQWISLLGVTSSACFEISTRIIQPLFCYYVKFGYIYYSNTFFVYLNIMRAVSDACNYKYVYIILHFYTRRFLQVIRVYMWIFCALFIKLYYCRLVTLFPFLIEETLIKI